MLPERRPCGLTWAAVPLLILQICQAEGALTGHPERHLRVRGANPLQQLHRLNEGVVAQLGSFDGLGRRDCSRNCS
jgi:hypothetical protein